MLGFDFLELLNNFAKFHSPLVTRGRGLFNHGP